MSEGTLTDVDLSGLNGMTGPIDSLNGSSNKSPEVDLTSDRAVSNGVTRSKDGLNGSSNNPPKVDLTSDGAVSNGAT